MHAERFLTGDLSNLKLGSAGKWVRKVWNSAVGTTELVNPISVVALWDLAVVCTEHLPAFVC